MAIIRNATTATDWADATDLLWDYVRWVRAETGLDPLHEQPSLALELADLAGHFGGEDAPVLLAHHRRRPVGTVTMRCDADGSAELKRLYVTPDARRLGVADRLVDRVLATAAARSCRTVWLESLPGPMDPAIALYRRHGFVETPQRERTAPIDGLIVMERSLRPTLRGDESRLAS